MDALEAIRKRRSVREYTGEAVPREDLEQIVDAGRLAPTGWNPGNFNSRDHLTLTVAANIFPTTVTPTPSGTTTLISQTTTTPTPSRTATTVAITTNTPTPSSTATTISLTTATPTPSGTATPTPTSTIIPNPSLKECEDGIDNDGDNLIDYPADPQCASRKDNKESR